MKDIIVTRQQACHFLVEYHGLADKRMFVGEEGIYDYIDKVGCIQFDPLNIVGHNHELVLQSRIRGFRPSMLQKLLYEDRRLIDGWDKNMSIYPVKDWPYFERLREADKLRYGNPDKPIYKVLPQIRRELEERGPLSSNDLDYNETVNWSWAPTRIARAALESMYFWGELIIHHKEYTRRVYDFAYRHIPETVLSAPDPNLTNKEFYSWYVLRRIGGIGMLWNRAGDAWLGISGLKADDRNSAFNTLIETEKILPIKVEEIKNTLYIKSEDLHLLERILQSKTAAKKSASIIAPLDNMLWDRRLIKELFNFDYKWEVYKPVNLRSYGYYVLPVLYGDRFVARFEPGWDNKTKTFIIKNWWWEPGIKQTAKLSNELGKCFKQFSEFLETDSIKLSEELSVDKGLDWLKDLAL